jgi:streptogramin lyase
MGQDRRREGGAHRPREGIGTDGTSVWACIASDTSTGIVRIDPVTMEVGAPIDVGKVFDQLSLPHTSRGLWVLTGSGETLAVVDPATREVATYQLGAKCLQVAAAETLVIVTCANEDVVLALNPLSGEILARTSLTSPRIAAVWGEDVWVDTSAGLTRLGTDLAVKVRYPNQVIGPEGDLVVTEDAVWVRGAGGVLWRIDPQTDNVVEQLTSDRRVSAGGLLLTPGAIWASENNEGIVVHLRR